MWDDDDVEYARNQLLALGKAVHSHAAVYVDFPSHLQAAALNELLNDGVTAPQLNIAGLQSSRNPL